MKEQEKNKIVFRDKNIHIAKSRRGGNNYSSDGIRLDNFHGFSHIHLTLDGIHNPIKYDNVDGIIVFLLNRKIAFSPIIKFELFGVVDPLE